MSLEEAEEALSRHEWRKCSSFCDSYRRSLINRALKYRIAELNESLVDCKDVRNNHISIDINRISDVELTDSATKVIYNGGSYTFLHKDCYEYLLKIIDFKRQ